MKATLKVFSIPQGEQPNIMSNALRAKLIITDSEERPSYIEVDNQMGNDKEPVIRVNFGDNTHWNGSLEELKLKLLK